MAVTNRVVGQRQDQRGVVNTRHVAAARGLVVLRVKGERVYVNAYCGDVGVVLEGLDQVEVLALTLGEPIVTVQLHLGNHRGVLARKTLNCRNGVTRLQGGAVKPVRVVERLLSLVNIHRAVAGHEVITLDNPDQFLHRVVEGHLDLVGAGRNRLIAGELQLLNQVLVGDLSEATALLRIQVDVVNVQGRRHQARGVHAVADVGHVGPAQVAQLVELQVDLHLVVLEGDQRQRQARVAVEPELQRDVHRVLGRTVATLAAGVGLTAGTVIVAAAVSALRQGVDEFRHVAHHLRITGLLASRARQFIPDMEPVTVVLVDALSTNLNLDVADKVVSNPVEPTELRTRTILDRQADLGESGLKVDAVDKITITGYRTCHTLAKVGNTVEGLLNRLHREVRVATIQLLEKRHLRVRRKIYILGTISN